MADQRVADLEEWYGAQYASAVGLAGAEGGERFKKFVAGFPARSDFPSLPYPITGRVRMASFLSLKLRYPLGASGYTCLAITASTGSSAANFAYAYWRRGRELEDPEYVCVAPTFASRDGEYRKRFVGYPAFAANCDKLAEMLSPFEEATIAMARSGLVSLESRAYPESDTDAIIARADGLRLPVVAFAVALALDLFESAHGLLMAHTSEAYATLMKAVAGAYPALVELSRKCMLTVPELSVFIRGGVETHTVQCGQKIVPLFVREVTLGADYNHSAWRELAVARLAGDLVLNYVSPSFAQYNQWTYVEGADAALFENPAMGERYARGRAAERATGAVRGARRALAEPGVPPSAHLAGLDALYYDSIEYAQSYLLMSPVALVHTMEDVGWALRSLAAYVRLAPAQWPAAVNAFASADSAARHLFEFAYGAHCLHTKLGVAHTDLHGNNMTFYMWGVADLENGAAYEPVYGDPVVAYVAGPRGEADTYVFPAAGDSGCIIDYSRCILGPAFRARLEEGRAPRYATNFYRDQVGRVMRTLFRYAPAFVEKNEEALRAAVIANFDAVFPVLCAVDFVAIGRSVAAALREAADAAPAGGLRPFAVAREAFDLAGRLERAAEEALGVGLADLAEAAGARARMRVPEFPGRALLEQVFGEWRFPRWAARAPARLKAAALVDAYNYQNPLEYSGADYAKYPPWARLDEIERHLGEHKITDLFERGVEPFLEALKPGGRLEAIAERLRAEHGDRGAGRGADPWLDE